MVDFTLGKMDRKVEIVEFVSTKNNIGATSRTQQTVKTVWAQLIFKTSGEEFDQKIFSINKRDYVIHYDPDIAAKLLQSLAVVDDGITYYVTGANPDYEGRKKAILLNCKQDG